MKVKITGVGKYVPAKVLTNADLEKIVDTNDEWIVTRTGIQERHIAAENESTSTMAAEAGRQAIADAGLKNEDIGMVIVATLSPDMLFPATACLVQNILGMQNVGTVDIEAACSGFVYGLSQGYAYVKSGLYKHVLVIGAETMSRFVDWKDRGTCVLFGDGAGAVVVSAAADDQDSDILDFILGGDGQYGDLLSLPGGGSLRPASQETVNNGLHYLKMSGNIVFKLAVRTMSEMAETLMQKHGLSKQDVRLVIPHQANYRITKSVKEHLGLEDDQVFSNIHKYGNTSGATIPIALREAMDEGRIRRGEYFIIVAFGGGFTWGASLIRL